MHAVLAVLFSFVPSNSCADGSLLLKHFIWQNMSHRGSTFILYWSSRPIHVFFIIRNTLFSFSLDVSYLFAELSLK